MIWLRLFLTLIPTISKWCCISARVLVVEDDEIVAKLIKRIVEHKGLKVDVAYSGEQALDILLEKKYRTAFIDMRLPGVRGKKLIETIEKDYPNMHIVAIPGEPDDITHIKTGIYFGVIYKPITVQSINKALS